MSRAVTLIETLTVAAILVILAAISFPIIATAKRAAKWTQSESNLRQVFLSTELYRADHEGTGNWGSCVAMGLPENSLAIFPETSAIINSPFIPRADSLILGRRYYHLFGPDTTFGVKWSAYSQDQKSKTVLWIDPFINDDPYPLTTDVKFTRRFLFVDAQGSIGVHSIKGDWAALENWIR